MHVGIPPEGYCLKPSEELREFMRRSIFLARGGSGLPEKGKPLATIGDYTSRLLLERGYRPQLIVIDCMVERQRIGCLPSPPGYRVVRVANPRGCITWSLWREVSAAWGTKPTIIYVDGEDDLAAIPAIIEAPDEALIAYGIPWSGLAVVNASWARTLAETITRCSSLESLLPDPPL